MDKRGSNYVAMLRASIAVLATFSTLAINSAAACPFCTAIRPTLVQQREEAAAVILAEAGALIEAKARIKATGRGAKSQRFDIHSIIAGEKLLAPGKPLQLPSTTPLKAGTLALLFGQHDREDSPPDWAWTVQPVNETSAAYFMSAPGLRVPTLERLKYFAKFLEHADPQIAEDAYFEFGHAGYEDVLRVADKLDMAKLREWAVDPNMPEHRQGFYLFALGMAKLERDRTLNRALLLDRVKQVQTDFRAGYDGALAGYLLLTGKPGLECLEQRFFANPKAAHGDIRHALQALRFYHDQGPAELRAQQCELIASLIDRPEFAAAVITDLARWQHWSVVDRVVKSYSPDHDGATRRAIVGYLLACPLPTAATALDDLRRRDQQGVADAEQAAAQLSSGK